MKSLLASIIVVFVAGGIGAAQQSQSPQAFAGKWEMAVGAPQATVFDRVLELSVDGTTLTGTMTIGSRTVKLVGEVKDGSMTLRPEPPLASMSQGEDLVGLSGGFRDDGTIRGTYSRRVNGRSSLTGWQAKRPA